MRSLRASTFRGFEVVLVDNGSTEPLTKRLRKRVARRPGFRVIDAPGPFNFSKVCNTGAAAADGDFLLFLNNDTEVLARDWLEHLMSIAADPRVASLEATDARDLTPALVPEPIELAAVDASFISLKLVLPSVMPLLAPRTALAALIKPQFEAGPAQVKKGIVRDPAVHETVCRDIAALVESLGFRVIGLVPSPILGGEGNREFLIGARRG